MEVSSILALQQLHPFHLHQKFLSENFLHVSLSLKNYEFQGADARKRMDLIRKGLSEKPGMKMQGSRVVRYVDYQEGIDGLPKSDVLKLWTKNGSEIVLRPSGTEPKIKVYVERIV